MTPAELAADFLAGDRWRDPLQQLIACDRLDECGRPLDAAMRRVLIEPGEDRHRLDYADAVEADGRVAAWREARAALTSRMSLAEGFRRERELELRKTAEPAAARAEFVRVQMKLEKPYNFSPFHPVIQRELYEQWLSDFGPNEVCRHYNELRRRERELWDKVYRDFDVGVIPGMPLLVPEADCGLTIRGGRGEVKVKARRGFVASITLSCADLLAHAGAVFACQPVTAVRLSDREPVLVGSHRTRTEPWSFPVSDRPDRRDAIPWVIFEAGGSREWHPTREAAVEWVSAACVAFGRDLARLPPLPAGAAGR